MLQLLKKELEVSFDKKEFRYVKIIVTDTNSSNNKYICLSKIDFSYQEKCTNISCNELTYYNSWEIQNDKLASFGHLVSGNGIITYNVKEKISSFVLLGYALEDSTLKISIDNKSYSVDLKANGSLIKLYEEIFLTNLENTIIKIEVISGSIAVDSAYVGNL